MSDQPKLIIRADADSKMGTGHVMRCLALAQDWQDRGGKVTFVGRIVGQSLQRRISNEGFYCVDIKRPYPEPDDLPMMLSLIKKNRVADDPWMVVDGYHFTADYVRKLRAAGVKVLVIDDYAHQSQYNADLLLNQNLGSEKIVYPINSDANVLAGIKYVLLRREFLKQKKHDHKNISSGSNHVLVTMGGADPDNVTLKVIEALEQVNLPQLEVKIIVGAANLHSQLLKKRMAQVLFKWELLYSLDNMAPLMQWADIAVTAGGSTCWELACMGVPALIVSLAENQFAVAESMAMSGAGSNCGQSQALQPGRLAKMISDLFNNEAGRKAMALAGQKLVDGRGGMRVVERMFSFPFSFRRVREDDCQQLYDWTNDPVVREASFFTNAISWKEHQHWFNNRLNDGNCLFLIALSYNEQPVGQIRFDIDGNEAVISISIAEAMRNKGQGSKIIQLACARFFADQQICLIKAFVKKENKQSLKVFKQAGFLLVSETVIHGAAAVEMSLKRR